MILPTYSTPSFWQEELNEQSNKENKDTIEVYWLSIDRGL